MQSFMQQQSESFRWGLLHEELGVVLDPVAIGTSSGNTVIELMLESKYTGSEESTISRAHECNLGSTECLGKFFFGILGNFCHVVLLRSLTVRRTASHFPSSSCLARYLFAFLSCPSQGRTVKRLWKSVMNLT